MKQVKQEIAKILLGKEDVIEKVLMAFLAKGHILLEDIPGVGKTTLAVGIQKSMDLSYRRIQFTPDVLPSDIVGYYMYKKQEDAFVYQPGAILCNLFLADEINRTSSRTQSALLEVMEEGQISVEGTTHPLPDPFCVIATQNPFGSAGTQRLPDSQLDRFMICISLGYPDKNAEKQMLLQKLNPALEEIHKVLSKDQLLKIQQEVANVYVSEPILNYIIKLVDLTRHHEQIAQGASPRASIALMKMGQASAYMEGRDFVLPADIQKVWYEVLHHRIVLKHESNLNKETARDILTQILSQIEDPSIQVKHNA